MTTLLVTLAVLAALMVTSVRTSKVPVFRPAPSRKMIAMLAKRKMWARIRGMIFRPLNPATNDGLAKRLWALVPAALALTFVALYVLTGASRVALGWSRKASSAVTSRRAAKRSERIAVEADVVKRAGVARRYNMQPREVQLAG